MHACVNVHTVHVDVCGHNDVRGNNELADALSQACGHQGQKHVVCLCVCYNKWVRGVGKSVIFKILTMCALKGSSRD